MVSKACNNELGTCGCCLWETLGLRWWEDSRLNGWARPLGPGPMPTWHCLSCCWSVDFLRNLFSQTLGLGSQKERLLDELSLEGVTRYMQSERCEFPTPGPK